MFDLGLTFFFFFLSKDLFRVYTLSEISLLRRTLLTTALLLLKTSPCYKGNYEPFQRAVLAAGRAIGSTLITFLRLLNQYPPQLARS